MTDKLMVRQEAWSAKATEFLASACDDDYTVEQLQEDCEKGDSSLFNIFDADNAHIACMVMRIDGGLHKELVVVAGGGYLKGGSLYKILTPYVEAIAASNGCKYLRGHTRRKSIGKLMNLAGWEQSEIIFRKRVDHGREIQQ